MTSSNSRAGLNTRSGSSGDSARSCASVVDTAATVVVDPETLLEVELADEEGPGTVDDWPVLPLQPAGSTRTVAMNKVTATLTPPTIEIRRSAG